MGRHDPGDQETSIPSYDEAIAPTPTSATAFLGPTEISHDAERQGLLGQASSSRRPTGYHPPTVESARSSFDFSVSSGGSSARQSAEGLRQEISQMEIEEPNTSETAWKRISGLTSNIHLPFRRWLPSWDRTRAMIPRLPQDFTLNPIIIIRIFALIFVLGMAYLLFFSGIFRWRNRNAVYFDQEAVRRHVQEAVNETKLAEYLEHLTQWDHMAGTKGNFYLAKWIESHMNEVGLEDVKLEQFDVYLNYPKENGQRVSIISPKKLQWSAGLTEDKFYPDRDNTPVFHGLSASGNVTGPLIYANYGSNEDFDRLNSMGIKLEGSIALVRYGGSQGDRSLKVKNAELAGAVGCLIYSDPEEDGHIRGPGWPDGRFRLPNSVERGSVAMTGFIAGDVLTPGYASLPGERNRGSKKDNPALNKIPSLPLSALDAQVLLQSLKGHGKKVEDGYWKGGVPDVEWWTGDEQSPIVHLENFQDEPERQPIFNIRAKIEGQEQPEKSIVLGNHYDSWCFGAADPGSGTAVMLEVMRAFGDLMTFGWRPRRTIEFVIFDAEEYNLIGSTEHVEARMDELRRNGFAYINVDVAATGQNFKADASPLFSRALSRVLKRTSDPATGRIMNDLWREGGFKFGELGAGSDYVAFQNFAGVSSIDLTFEGEPYPYHSCYENFEWMARFGDPGFHYHKLMGQIVALLTLELADEKILQFDLPAYANSVNSFTTNLERYVANLTRNAPSAKDKKLDFKTLHDAVKLFTENAGEVQKWADDWTALYGGTPMREGDIATYNRWQWNNKVAAFETNLLDVNGGLPTRPQYKHIIFAPDRWSGYDGFTFPGPRDALQDGDWKLAQQQLDLAASILRGASESLVE